MVGQEKPAVFLPICTDLQIMAICTQQQKGPFGPFCYAF
jgi:hypothetical protein